MAKVLIDLGTPGFPNTGDNLPAGGEKLNNHINDVYSAFARTNLADEEQTLHCTGVYKIITFADLILDETNGPGHLYEAEPGEMLFVDVNEETTVFIDLPGGYAADQVKVIAAETNTPVLARALGSQINGQESIELKKGVQYQYIRSVSLADGEWSQRIIDGSGAGTSTKEDSIQLTSDAGVVTIDCSLGNYFHLQLNESVTQFIFTNAPSGLEAATKIIRIDQEFDEAWTVDLESVAGHWSTNNYSDNIVDNTGLLAVTYIGGGSFNTWINAWYELV